MKTPIIKFAVVIACAISMAAAPVPVSPAPDALTLTFEAAPFVDAPSWSVNFTADGNFLWDPTDMRIIDWRTGKFVRPKAGGGTMEVSPDGKTIATVTSGDHGLPTEWNGVVLLDAATGKELLTTRIFSQDVTRFAFTSDSKRLFAFAYDMYYELEVPSGKLLKDKVPFANPRDFDISPDGTMYATARMVYPEGKIGRLAPSQIPVQISLYRMETKELIKAFEPVQAQTQGVAFTPDGKYLVTGARPDPLIYDVAALKRVPLDKADYSPRAFQPLEGRYLVGFNEHSDTNIVWDLTTGKVVPLKLPDRPGNRELFGARIISGVSPDGRHLAVRELRYGKEAPAQLYRVTVSHQ